MIHFSKVGQSSFEMSHKILLRLCFSVLLLRAGVATTESLTGIVGESVMFPVKTNLSFVSISWSKEIDSKVENISVVTFGDPCVLQVPLPALENRVNVSKDCRGLNLSHLEQDDRGTYVAAIFLTTGKMEKESFELAVERASRAEKLNSNVGSVVIFEVKTNLSFDSISWSKIVGNKSENIAVVTFGKPCDLLVPLPAYETRMKVSEDCRELELDELEKGDAGRYTAEIIAQNKTVAKESFDLRVSRLAQEEYLTGIVGGSVTFPVNTNLPFDSITRSKIIDSKPENVSLVTFGNPCGLQVLLPALENRVNVSEDCRGLNLSHLEQDDRGLYYAVILLPTGEMEQEAFYLHVERHLLDSEMRVTCTPDRAGNGNWKLNCSTGDWKDRVEFNWESLIYRPLYNPESAVIKVTSKDLNVKVTCRARNRISQASRTVFLKDVCSGQTKNLSRLPLWALLCLGLGGSLLLSGCMELIPMEKSRKADGGGGRRAQPHPGDD